MNEQMTKLIIKTFGKDGIIDRRASGDWILTDDDLDKFAEMIVQACALQCNHNEDMDNILDHFGVK